MNGKNNLAAFDTLLKRGFAALQNGDVKQAEACCREVLTANPRIAQAHFLVGLISLETGNRKIAASAFNTVTTLDPKNAASWAHLSKIFSELGYTVKADDALKKAEAISTENPVIQNVLGAVCTALGDHEKAKIWYGKAHQIDPGNPGYGVNLANAQSFTGQTDDASKTIKEVLEISPENPQAHWILSGLDKATSSVHASEMMRLSEKYADNPHRVSFLSYGAGKQFEDLGAWNNAFAAFEKGAQAKREIVTFDESAEEQLFTTLSRTYTKKWLADGESDTSSDAPVFIIGQPRTGTTLIERILTSHSKIASAGELQQFYLSIRRMTKVETPARITPELMMAAARLDPTELGSAYIHATRKHAESLPHFVDKLPVNYLYAPLIAKALPNAKIIHIVRDSMDSCFSSFKQLFADTYLHSYDLEEMARHHVRYRRLMDDWRAVLGPRMLDVSYEETVTDLESNARRLIDFIGLEWEDSCLDFHKQSGAVSTASAVQVREPAHTRSVGRWRKYEQQLAPVVEIMQKSGIQFK